MKSEDVEMKHDIEMTPAIESSQDKEDEISSKIEAMEVDSQTLDEDEAFDKEIEEAAAEEKEAKQEKIEMMTIIHTL